MMSEAKENQLATRIIIGLFTVAAAAQAAYAKTPAGSGVEPCCPTGSQKFFNEGVAGQAVAGGHGLDSGRRIFHGRSDEWPWQLRDADAIE